MRNVIAPGAHDYKICSSLIFCYWNRDFRAEKENSKDIERDLKRVILTVSEVFEVENRRFCKSKAQQSTIVTLVTKIFFTGLFRRLHSVLERKDNVRHGAADG